MDKHDRLQPKLDSTTPLVNGVRRRDHVISPVTALTAENANDLGYKTSNNQTLFGCGWVDEGFIFRKKYWKK